MNERQKQELKDKGETPALSSIDRAILRAMGEGRSVGREDDPAKEELRHLWGWMTKIYIDKERLKDPATVTIRLVSGGVVATVWDKTTGYSVEAVCEHLQDALKELDQTLADPNCILKTGRKEPKFRKRQKD